MSLDPQIEWVLDLREKADYPPMETLDAPAARFQFEETVTKLDCDPVEMASVEDLMAMGPAGEVPIRLYVPSGVGQAPGPALVFYHGGGWVIGNLDTHDRVCRALAAKAGCRVVSVDYRLAPENPFPAATDDSVSAFLWLHENAATVGLDPARLAVGGDSAGGNLSAVVAQQARDHDAPACFQLLIYPATDMRGGYGSLSSNGDGYLLTADLMAYFYDHYVGGEQEHTDPRQSPILGNLAGLPSALVMTAGYDPLRDEGRAYADALKTAGVSVELSEHPGMIHGFFQMSGAVDEAKRAVDASATALRAAFDG